MRRFGTVFVGNSSKEMTIMNTYLWQDKTFPHWTWDTNSLLNPLGEVHTLQGLLLGRMAVLGFDGLSQQVEAITSEIVGSSQIEGVALNADSVRSSVARHLGLDTANNERSDHYTEGVVNSLLDATKHHDECLDGTRHTSQPAIATATK